MTKPAYRSFNRWVLALVALPLVLLAGFNFLMDPYRVWASPRAPRINEATSFGVARDWLVIARKIRDQKPKAIIFGTSTSMQLDPGVYGSMVGESALNAGIVMASPGTVRSYLEMALREQPQLDHVLIALDFLQFNDLGDSHATTRRPAIVPAFLTEEGLLLLFSKDGTAASASTLAQNVTGRHQVEVSATGGPATFKKYLDTAMVRGGNYTPFRLSEDALGDLDETVRMCQARGVDLRVVITPMHSEHMDALYAAGLGDEYQQWLRRVTAITPVWDFSGYSRITTERVVDNMKYYHDPLHYTLAVGSQMIRRVYGESTESLGFGVYLTHSNIEEHFATMTKQRARSRITRALRESAPLTGPTRPGANSLPRYGGKIRSAPQLNRE